MLVLGGGARARAPAGTPEAMERAPGKGAAASRREHGCVDVQRGALGLFLDHGRGVGHLDAAVLAQHLDVRLILGDVHLALREAVRRVVAQLAALAEIVVDRAAAEVRLPLAVVIKVFAFTQVESSEISFAEAPCN